MKGKNQTIFYTRDEIKLLLCIVREINPVFIDFLQMSEKGQSVIELHEVPAGIMDVLLDFVYTETVNVGVENVQELLPAACLLQLTGQ